MRTRKISAIFICVFSMLLSFTPIICQAQDEIEKINLDPNKQITKGGHQIPSPKTQKANLTARTNVREIKNVSEPIAANIIDKSSGDEVESIAVNRENSGT